MTKKFTGLSIKQTNDVLASKPVRATVQARADRILPTARSIAFSSGARAFGNSLRAESGIRPGAKSPTGIKRPFTRITGDVTEDIKRADARSKLSRQQILRRATR